jgi:hypothetical protein
MVARKKWVYSEFVESVKFSSNDLQVTSFLTFGFSLAILAQRAGLT